MGVNEISSPSAEETLLAGVIVSAMNEETKKIEELLYDHVVITEITGREEDVLAEKDSSVSQKMSRVLAGCIRQISNNSNVITDKNKILTAVKNMTVGDRIFLFIRLRILTLGENFIMEFDPPDGKMFTGNINLNELETTSLDDKSVRRKTIIIGDKKVVIRLATGNDEESYARLENNKLSRATKGLMQRIVTIDDKSPTVEILQNLSLRLRNALRGNLEKFDVGVDTTVSAIDPKTNKEFDVELGIGQKGFFFPLET